MLGAGAACGALVACAGGGAADVAQCQSADWFALGRSDGAAGARLQAFDKPKRACAGVDIVADFEQYAAGRAEGVGSYCSPQGGFDAGYAGAAYRKVCPPDAEPDFLNAYQQGRRLARMTRAIEKARTDLRRARSDLDRHESSVTIAQKQYSNPYSSSGDRMAAFQDIEHHKREIERLVRALPRMQEQLKADEKTLEAFRAELTAAGRLTP